MCIAERTRENGGRLEETAKPAKKKWLETPGTKGLAFALGCYTLLFVIQLAAYFGTHVLVLLAQSFETLSDVLISTALILVTVLSSRPADEEHHFGHERAQNVAAIVSATILISFFSIESIRRGIEGLLHQVPHEHHTGVALAVTLAGMVIVSVPILVIRREKSDAPTARAQLVSLARDEIAYVLVLVAIILTIKDVTWADPVGSIIIGVIIAFAAIYLFRKNYAFLIGKAPDVETMEKLIEAADSAPGVSGVHDIAAEYIGPSKIHVDMHISVKPHMSIEEANEIVTEVRARLQAVTGTDYSGIHVDPAATES